MFTFLVLTFFLALSVATPNPLDHSDSSDVSDVTDSGATSTSADVVEPDHSDASPFSFDTNPVIELTEGNHIVLRGEINEQMVSKAIVDLGNVDSNDVLIYITSPGGSVMAGNNLIQFLSYLRQKGKRIVGIADQAASMAFCIFQECDVRYVTPSSILMQHQMSVGVSDQYENLKNRIKLLDSINRDATKRQAARIGLTEAEFNAKVLSDWWIYGAENVDANTADGVVQVGCSRTLLEETVEQTVRTFFGPVDLVFSKCPVSRAPLEVKATFEQQSLENIEKFRDDWLKAQTIRVHL